MSSTQPRQVTIITAAAAVNHPSHWQAILAAIMACLNAVEPIIIALVPPAVVVGLEVTQAIEPIIIQATQSLGQ